MGCPGNLNFASERQFPDFDHQKKSPRTRNNVPITLSIVGRGMLWDTLDPNYHPKRLSDLQTKSASISFWRKTLLNILPSLNHRGCQPHWQAGELGTIYLYFINYKTIHALNSIKHIYTNPKVSLYLFSGHINKGSLIGSDKGEVFVLIFSCGKVSFLVLFVNMPNPWKILTILSGREVFLLFVPKLKYFDWIMKIFVFIYFVDILPICQPCGQQHERGGSQDAARDIGRKQLHNMCAALFMCVLIIPNMHTCKY